MKTSVEKLEGNSVKLTVTIPAEMVDAAIDEAYKRAAAKLRIPGFRPGKAPRPVVDTHVGKEYVLADATEDVINTSYPKALDAEGLRPIESPEMDEMEPVVAGQEFTFDATVEVRPELTLTSTDPVDITVPPAKASDAEVDAQIEHYRERFASLEPVEDRAIRADDFVLLSFVGKVDGEEYEGNVVDKYLYEMGRGLMPPEFDEGLVGLNPGDETTVEFVIPETSAQEEFIGKTASFEITVHEVKAKVFPEVDDEFAANVGGYDNMAEMRDEIRSRLDGVKESAHERMKERAVREAIAERLEGEVPESMVRSRAANMLRDFANGIAARGMNLEQYMEMAGVDADKIEADMNEQALAIMRQELALEALVRQAGLDVTDADVEAELGKIAEASESSIEETRERWAEAGLMAVVREQAVHTKATEWLLESASVTEEATTITEEAAAEAGPDSDDTGSEA